MQHFNIQKRDPSENISHRTRSDVLPDVPGPGPVQCAQNPKCRYASRKPSSVHTAQSRCGQAQSFPCSNQRITSSDGSAPSKPIPQHFDILTQPSGANNVDLLQEQSVQNSREASISKAKSSKSSRKGPAGPEQQPKRRRADATQVKVLNQVFDEVEYPNTQKRALLAIQLHMTPKQVQTWSVRSSCL